MSRRFARYGQGLLLERVAETSALSLSASVRGGSLSGFDVHTAAMQGQAC
jgi:hypothetical protein